MRSTVTEYLPHQGTPIPTVTISSTPDQSQCPYIQYIVNLSGNESLLLTPKHSPKQSSKSKESLKIDVNGKEPFQVIYDKLDSDQQEPTQPSDQARSSGLERSVKERKESRASDRTKKKSWYIPLFSTYKSRSEEVKRYFKDVPQDERLVVDYSCALQRDILIQGRLYITQNYLCFYANIFGWETCVCIKLKDVSSITKEKTALVIPNAILVSTETEKLFFTTFTARDKAYVMLFRVWQNALMDKPLMTQELWQLIHTAYGEELGLTSDDEDYNYIPPGANLEEKLSPTSAGLSSASLTEGCSALIVEKSGSEIGSSATDSTNKSHGTVPSQQVCLPANSAQVTTETMPTDLSDNSSDSDVDPAVDINMATCTSPHDGRLIVSKVLPIHVDQLFQLLFTNSKFLVELHTLRRTTDFKTSAWRNNPDTNEKIRTVSMVAALTQSLGPKSSNVHETQILQPCSKHGELYSIDGEVVNSGIPYADSFYVVKHYCLEKVRENKSSLNVYAQLKYKKNVWGFMKNVIERNTWAGLQEFYEELVKALQAVCEETVPKGRKARRRQCGIPSNPALLPMDPMQSSVRGTAVVEGEKRSNTLLYTVLAVLVFLILFNGLLFYKLRVLEDQIQFSNPRVWYTDLDVLNNPKSHEEWLKALRHQESLHRMELDKWQQVLQLTVQLLRKSEEYLNGLRGSVKSYPEDVINVLDKKQKEEL